MVIIRECIEEDFESVLKLLEQLWAEREVDEKALQEVFIIGLNSELQHYACAVLDGRVVGFGSLNIKNSLWQTGFLGHINELVVDQEYRGRGIGGELLEYLANIAKTKGCARIELDTAFKRKKAHQFYEQKGFENRAFLFSKEI